MSDPPLSLVRQYDTHRLIPSKYCEGGDSVLGRIADDDAHLHSIFDLDHATSRRLLGENHRLPGIDERELVFGVPNYRTINAAFCHAHPLGGRFNGPDRGSWYCAFDVETSLREVIFHKTVELAEVEWFNETVTYDDYLADFSGQFHDLRPQAQPTASGYDAQQAYPAELAPESYRASQKLGQRLLSTGSAGIVYPSVRHSEGTCLACFRPALVGNLRRSLRFELTWSGGEEPSVRSLGVAPAT